MSIETAAATAPLFLILVTILVVGVYLAPAIALRPQLVFDSRVAFVVPALSVLVVTLMARLLNGVDLFTPTWVLGLSAASIVTACVRLYRITPHTPRHWPSLHIWLYVFSLCALLPVAVIQGHNGFSTNDEIYSWNLWALQHMHGEPVDETYTRAPYPQSFPYLIAWCYQLVGSINLQLPVKTALSMLAIGAVAALTMTGSMRSSPIIAARILLVVFTLYVADVYEVLATGLAEVLMVPTLLASVALYLSWSERGDARLIALSAATGLIAALSKQPGLLWIMLALPVLALFRCRSASWAPSQLWPVALGWLIGGIWLLTEGSGFQDNSGVVEASRQGRDLFDQLIYAIDRHLIQKPAFLLLLVGAALVTHISRRGIGVFWMLLVPSLLAWLIWGAYNTRLGTHVVLLSALLIAFGDFAMIRGASLAMEERIGKALQPLIMMLCLVATVYAAAEIPKQLDKRDQPFLYYDAPQNVIRKFFGSAADPVLKVFRSDAVVWAPSAYIYGIFFKHNVLARSDNSRVDPEQLRRDLLAARATIVIDDGYLATLGNTTRSLRALRASPGCKPAFEELAVSPLRFEYVVYRVDLSLLEDCSP